MEQTILLKMMSGINKNVKLHGKLIIWLILTALILSFITAYQLNELHKKINELENKIYTLLKP